MKHQSLSLQETWRGRLQELVFSSYNSCTFFVHFKNVKIDVFFLWQDLGRVAGAVRLFRAAFPLAFSGTRATLSPEPDAGEVPRRALGGVKPKSSFLRGVQKSKLFLNPLSARGV